MKQLILFTFIFELFLSPLELTLTDHISRNALADEICATGKVFDTTLNRCIISKDVVDAKNQANQCDGLTGDEFKACFNDNVTKDLSDAQAENKVSGQSDPGSMSSAMIPAVVSIGAAYVLFSEQQILQQCGSTSAWLMMGAGVATLLGEVMAQNTYKKSLSGMMSEYRSRMSDNSTDSEENIEIITQNQTIAFDYQIEQEQARKKAHQARKSTYQLAFGLYSAGVVAAVVEQLMYATGETSICNLSGSAQSSSLHDSQNKTYNHSIAGYHYIQAIRAQEVVEIVFRKLTQIFPSANASDIVTNPNIERIEVIGNRAEIIAAAEAEEAAALASKIPIETQPLEAPVSIFDKGKEAADSIGTSIKNALRTPWVRGALSGTLALYAKSIADKAQKLQKQSETRIDFLTELKQDFIASGGAGFQVCTDDDRKNPAKPACYCYNQDGEKNSSRTTSATCQTLWQDATLLAANSYNSTAASSSSTTTNGCLTTDGGYSASCCSSASESNQCSTISGSLSLGQLGSLTGLADTMSDTASFINGKLGSSNLNGSSYENLAINSNKVLDKMKEDPLKAPTLEKINELSAKLEKSFAAKVKRSLAKGSLSPSLASLGVSQPSSPLSSAKDVLASMKDDLQSKRSSRKSTTLKSKPNFDDFDFGTGSGNSAGIVIDDTVSKVMKKNYKINDINSNPDNDIFKIITNRYHSSAFRRLFKEETKAKTGTNNK